MATYTLTNGTRNGLPTTGGAGASTMRWLREQGHVFADWMERRRRYNETVRELESLSAKELDDIGIAPCDIHRVARASTQTS